MAFPPDAFPLASIQSMRPVFLIVMGGFLLFIAWRLNRGSHGWTSRLTMAGAMMLCFGYSVVMPLYLSGRMVPLQHLHAYPGEPWVPVFWHCVKSAVMNLGWLFFGLGVAAHARMFEAPRKPARVRSVVTRSIHEPVA